jgi:hypothetical protein
MVRIMTDLSTCSHAAVATLPRSSAVQGLVVLIRGHGIRGLRVRGHEPTKQQLNKYALRTATHIQRHYLNYAAVGTGSYLSRLIGLHKREGMGVEV